VPRSRLEIWWWLKKTYAFLFCIEVESTCVGFIGLYDLDGETAEVTLVMFDGSYRRRGYGSMAFTAVVAELRRSSFIKRLIIRVDADNYPSVSFWKKLGFEELEAANGIRTMEKDLRGESP
jgi:RimJ/RimL family protein N-acetyltransferase